MTSAVGLVLLLAVGVVEVSSDSAGAPWAACDNMRVSHGSARAQRGPSPVKILHNICGGYGPSGKYKMVLSSTADRNFTGFFCRGQFEGTNSHASAAGFFPIDLLPRLTHHSRCRNPKSAITQTRLFAHGHHNSPGRGAKYLEFGYVAPPSTIRSFYFRCTILEGMNKFWENVRSEVIRPRRRGLTQTNFEIGCRPNQRPTPAARPTGVKGACPSGPPGLPGAKGERGSPGPAGRNGWNGRQGSRGQKGQKGEPGQVLRLPLSSSIVSGQGSKGDHGRKGERGQKGERGGRGLPGFPGPRGFPGPVGLQGSPGPQGSKGQKGDSRFPRGPLGQKGSKGSTGQPGPSGPPGGSANSALSGLEIQANELLDRVENMEQDQPCTEWSAEVERIERENERLQEEINKLKEKVERLLEAVLPSACARCNKPLGMADGRILDSQISASSNLRGMEPHKARLNSTGVWAPLDPNEAYIEINLLKAKTITAIHIKGMPNGRIWTTTYQVYYKLQQGDTWTKHSKVCLGNTDSVNTAVCELDCDHGIDARYVRLQILTYQVYPALQFELLGCDPS